MIPNTDFNRLKKIFIRNVQQMIQLNKRSFSTLSLANVMQFGLAVLMQIRVMSTSTVLSAHKDLFLRSRRSTHSQ